MTYRITNEEEIIKVTKLYHDGKTQVPQEVIDLFHLQKGKSKLVWLKEGENKIVIKSSKKG